MVMIVIGSTTFNEAAYRECGKVMSLHIKRVSVQCVHAEESNGITTKVVTLKEIFEEGNYIDDD